MVVIHMHNIGIYKEILFVSMPCTAPSFSIYYGPTLVENF